VSGRVHYLLDTNIVSEMRKKQADESVLAFVTRTHSSSLYISVLTLGELRKGVTQKHRSDPAAAKRLATWVNGLESMFSDRIIGIDAATARLWGELSGQRTRPVVDTLLAATAIVHDMTLVTRNTRDVQDIDLKLLNPFAFKN
jgi:predicted nucleic acid-binding protein